MLETCYIHLEFQSCAAGVWSINLPFLCDKCGVCCTLDDFLTAGELQGSPEVNREVYAKFKVLTEELGELFEKDEKEYEHRITHSKCVFQTGNLCSIYEIRPKGCRQFPNTLFGMLSEDCRALDRFKKQCLALKKDWPAKETRHVTSDPIRPTCFSKKQYTACLEKLYCAGITEEELALFKKLNSSS